jgi:phosphoglycerate dehydrogenase-like enzyme
MSRIVSVEQLDEAVVRRLEALPATVRLLPHPGKVWQLPDELLPTVEIMLCKRPPANLDQMTALKLIQLVSVGYEHLRDLGFAERSLRLCNARGLYDTAIAEWVLAMMINLVRDLPGMFRNQQTAHWDRAAPFQQEIRGKVVGLWGYGGIGRETARLARACGMRVHVLTRRGVGPRRGTFEEPGTGDPEGVLPERVFTLGQERAFLAGLDFLVLALPHTKQSEGMIGAEQLQALPRTAFLLNPARGPIIQEAALLRALREGWIVGAALDTHFISPLPPEHPLWKMPNVIVTPHISGAERSAAYPARIAALFEENVRRFTAGRPLLNEITAQEWREA